MRLSNSFFLSVISVLFKVKESLEGFDIYSNILDGGDGWLSYFDYDEFTPVIVKKRQSPVDIVTSEVVFSDFEPLVFDGHWNLNNFAVIENTGTTVEISEDSDEISHPMLSGGPLKGKYVFSQAHFHWGRRSRRGSEHSIDGKRFSMEAHFVHYHSRFNSFEEARGCKNGVAVVAFFLKVLRGGSGIDLNSKKRNESFDLVVHHLDNIKNLGSESAETTILSSLKEIALGNDYFSYQGSLTTMPYSENVEWIVYRQYLSVQESQIEEFRHLMADSTHHIQANWRKTQPLNGRTIYYSSPSDGYDYS